MLNEHDKEWNDECENLIQILKYHEYDTDSIIHDLDDLIIDDEYQNQTKSNLYNLSRNATYLHHLKYFINIFKGLFLCNDQCLCHFV